MGFGKDLCSRLGCDGFASGVPVDRLDWFKVAKVTLGKLDGMLTWDLLQVPK